MLATKAKMKLNGNWQKGDHGGFELACMNPGVCVADTRDGRGPTDATYWRLGTLGYLKPSEHRDDFAIHGRVRQQASCLPN